MKKLMNITACAYLLFATFSLVASHDEYKEFIKSTKPNNSVSELQSNVSEGKTVLKGNDTNGLLKSLLKELKIAESSQILVFSKTSFQNDFISPKSPRAVYFNDEVYVGWVPYSKTIEISVFDPKAGIVFYTLDQSSIKKPVFTRETSKCFQCHLSSRTDYVPGNLLRSVFPDEKGFPILREGTFNIDQNSKIENRWGGYYVTGHGASDTHMGNKIATLTTDRKLIFDLKKNIGIENVDKFVNVEKYLKNTSDIVALMVLEHQSYIQNTISNASFSTLKILKTEKAINKFKNRAENFKSERSLKNIQSKAEHLVDEMFFINAPVLEKAIKSKASFKEDFLKSALKDSNGNSLKTFNLKDRIFEYPLSYLIYSKAFDNMPSLLKNRVYQRIWDILSGEDEDEKYECLDFKIRQSIVNILVETKKGLPKYWKKIN